MHVFHEISDAVDSTAFFTTFFANCNAPFLAEFDEGFSFVFFVPFKTKHVDNLAFVVGKIVGHNAVFAAVFDGHANRVINRIIIFTVFLEFIGKLAVVIQRLAECFQLLALARVQVVAVDDELQVSAGGDEGIAEPENFVVKAGVLAIIEHMKFRRRQVNQPALVDFFVEGLQVKLEQFVCVAEKADRHVVVDGALMLYQHEVDAVQGAGYIVFQAAEKAAVQRVDF